MQKYEKKIEDYTHQSMFTMLHSTHTRDRTEPQMFLMPYSFRTKAPTTLL